MEPELKRLLEQNLDLAKHNNKMLKAMRRDAWLGFAWKVTFWAIMLLAPLYFYQNYVAPIIDEFQGVQSEGSDAGGGKFGIPTFADIQKLVDSYRAVQK